ncbi:Hypothetical protein D9617_12g035910 [Elsinoe fawcettii]|nr:Hypothetical protein D9617_12g035910 [Elsinoe fawcettii]
MSVFFSSLTARFVINQKVSQQLFRAIQIPTRAARTRQLHTTRPPTIRWQSLPSWRSQRPSSFLRNIRSKRHYSEQKATSPNPTPNLGSPEPQTLSARMRKLSREYGWSALGVYLLLSAADFPFCFLTVRLVGTERIGHIEHAVVSRFWRVVEWAVPDWIDNGKAVGETEDGKIREGWGVEKAQEANKGENASLWTQLALAYAIHKSFIFIRVPLTAAVTPKVVKTLRGWGWNIGKRPSKSK